MTAGPELITLVVTILGLGVAAQVLADRLKIPSVLFLILAGIAVGPEGLGIVDITAFGGPEPLAAIVGLSVAIIVFEGHWVLPGGLIEQDETAREACVRETREEVSLDVTVEAFVGLYNDPDRDERGNVSAAYRCTPVGDGTPTPREETYQVDTFPSADLPEMGFDHEQIVTDALLE